MKNILYLYDASQTHTDAVFQHVSALSNQGNYKTYFYHHDKHTEFNCDLSKFDAVGLHYSVRLPYDQISNSGIAALRVFSGLKILFIQDEYEHTLKAHSWIKSIGFKIVFTVVPKESIEKIYPPKEFPGVTFVNVLTGYVPNLSNKKINIVPAANRNVRLGYRGRTLSLKYGQLGKEKIKIGELVKSYCDQNKVLTDIAWSESSRIYGDKWFEFISSCRGVLGSESGCNVFDWHGDLDDRIFQLRISKPNISDEEIYQKLILPLERPGLMNQISPRVFEAIICRTALVLFEGSYSNILRPDRHFITLKKDGENLKEVLEKIEDTSYIDMLTECAYKEIIQPGYYSYKSFVQQVEQAIEQSFEGEANIENQDMRYDKKQIINTRKFSSEPVRDAGISWYLCRAGGFSEFVFRLAHYLWGITPEVIRKILRPSIRRIFRQF